ncbi:MAG: hypothetical protein E6H10_08475 [Bacteroidetes bacterium]|nr:MAG: hypothetical protein E6H10_08475 [Bacteroidota bacterium]
MKQVLALILLLSHVNFAMFIAQVDEVDIIDSSGQQQEDINSLIQYVGQVFHIKHKPLKDSDNDSARYFHASKFDDYDFCQGGILKKEYFFAGNTKFPPYIEEKITSIYLDIQGPPPKA